MVARTVKSTFDILWQSYRQLNPRVEDIRSLLQKDAPQLVNDHIALRTLAHQDFGIGRLAEDFEALGYAKSGEYAFKAKKLRAIHLEHTSDKNAPKVFISALLMDECSSTLQALLDQYLIQCNTLVSASDDMQDNDALLSGSGRHWGQPKYSVYQALLEESEYAAWFYVFGFVPNHFTVKVNSLPSLNDMCLLNSFLERNGYVLNESGGKVKGSPEQFLEQSSTMADPVSIQFEEGAYVIPSVFYEFAKRYVMPNGEEFSGFVEGNADKIFESTHVK